MVRRILIVADESAHWKIAGLRQLERLALEINELGRAQDNSVQVSIQWSAEVPPSEQFVPRHPRLTRVEFQEFSPESADLQLSTHLFLPRNSATSPSFAQQISQGDHYEYLENSAQIAACEKRFLRAGGKSQDGLVSRLVNRPISRAVSRALLQTPVTPNAWTLLIFIFPLIGAVFLARGDYANVVAGILFFQIYSILDGCDGEIARARYLESPRGRQLDTACDVIGNLLLVLALGVGLSRLWEGIVVVFLIATNELLLAFAPAKSEPVSKAPISDSLYPRHQQMVEQSGLLSLGPRFAWWLIQLTKRDVAILVFLFLALAAQPAWILHLLGAVALVSSLLALKSRLR